MRILRSWMGEKEDVRNKIKRAGDVMGECEGVAEGV